MQSKLIFPCPICGHEYNVANIDACPKCAWVFQGYEDILGEDKECPNNRMTIREAKKNYSNGLNAFGEPIA